MPGRNRAVENGNQLKEQVVIIAESLGLESHTEFKVAKRIWGSDRRIDVVVLLPENRKTLGIECKFQGGQGTAEEKIPSTIQDMSAWPIPGLLVFAGEGLSQNMKSFLTSTGKAVELCDLEPWLRLFFGLDLE